MSTLLRVIIVDDEAPARDGLRIRLRREADVIVVAEFGEGRGRSKRSRLIRLISFFSISRCREWTDSRLRQRGGRSSCRRLSLLQLTINML